MKCPRCKQNEAKTDPALGIIPCDSCQNASRARGTAKAVEFTSESIKEDRKKFAKDILQPFRAGEVSKEYLKVYGSKGLNVTEAEAKRAVNTNDNYYD